jgi:hypothetical protein
MPWTGAEGSFSPPLESSHALVYSDLHRMSVCTSGDKNNWPNWGFVGSATLIFHRGYCLSDGRAILVGHRGAEPSSKRAHPWSFLLVSSLDLKNGAMMTGVMPHLSRSPIGGRWWCQQ